MGIPETLKTPKTPEAAPRPLAARLKRAAVVLLILLALVLTFWRPALKGLGAFLVVDQEPVSSDVVVVSGGRIDRILYGYQLVEEGLAPRILVLVSTHDCPKFWGVPCEESIERRLAEMGLGPSQVMTDTRAHSTRTDALFSRQIMEREGLSSAVVISDPFHMRRVSLTWRKAFSSSDARLTFSSVPWHMAELPAEEWWTTERGLMFVFTEYVKLALYWFKGYI